MWFGEEKDQRCGKGKGALVTERGEGGKKGRKVRERERSTQGITPKKILSQCQ